MARSLDGRLARLETQARQAELHQAEMDALKTMIGDLLDPEAIALGVGVDEVLDEARRLASMPISEARACFDAVYRGLSPAERQQADAIIRKWSRVLGVE